MVAYVVNASGLANDPTKYTPNGLPTSADTLTIGAFTLTIPSGYTLEFLTLSMGASTFANRSKCIINAGGKLKQYGDISFTNYSEIRAELAGVSEWDMNGFTTTFSASGTFPKYNITNDGLGKLKIYSPLLSTSTISSVGNLDVNGLEVIGTGFKFGAGFYAGMHYRLRNALFTACGQVGTVNYIEPTNDFIIDNVEIRGVTTPVASVISLFSVQKATATTVTGTQYIDNLLVSGEIPLPFTPASCNAVTLSGLIANGNLNSISYTVTDALDGCIVHVPIGATMIVATNGIVTNINNTTQRFWVEYPLRNVIVPYDMKFNASFNQTACLPMVARFESMTTVDIRSIKFRKCTSLNTLTPAGTWKKIFSDAFGLPGAFGEIGATPILDSYIVTMSNNPHTMENSCINIQNSVIDINPPSYTGDGSDDFIVTNTGTHLIKNSLIIDKYGGARLNALGVQSRSGSYTLDHCTVAVSPRSTSRLYGFLARNEASGIYSAAATTTVKNNICAILNNPTNSFDVRIYNLETAGNDQIDYLDYNTYSFVGVTPATVYFQVTSGTKGAIGSQTGWGLNDQMNVDPQFVDSTRDFWKFIDNTQTGLTDAEKIDYFLQSQNGFDNFTRAFDPAKKRTSITIDTLLAYVRAGYVVQNPLLNNSGSDGITRGAFAYQALSIGSVFTAAISSKLLSSSNLTTIALTTRS